ncbi:MAG: hypothetical protein CMK09_02585 [Ponticaulis sp.]|nr:hypothetical protein [Ponticaulis sp.]
MPAPDRSSFYRSRLSHLRNWVNTRFKGSVAGLPARPFGGAARGETDEKSRQSPPSLRFGATALFEYNQ